MVGDSISVEGASGPICGGSGVPVGGATMTLSLSHVAMKLHPCVLINCRASSRFTIRCPVLHPLTPAPVAIGAGSSAVVWWAESLSWINAMASCCVMDSSSWTDTSGSSDVLMPLMTGAAISRRKLESSWSVLVESSTYLQARR